MSATKELDKTDPAVAAWNAAVAAQMSGKENTKAQAVRRVVSQQPQLHADYVASVNKHLPKAAPATATRTYAIDVRFAEATAAIDHVVTKDNRSIADARSQVFRTSAKHHVSFVHASNRGKFRAEIAERLGYPANT